MTIVELVTKAEKFAIDNSPLILTTVSVTGAVASVLLAGQASFKAAQILENDRPFDEYPLPIMEQIQIVWPLYIPAAGTLVLTVTSIVFAHKVGARRAAALAAAYSISERAFETYKDKVVEHLGTKKEQVFRDEIAQKTVSDNPQGSKEVIISSGEVLCYDAFSGRYFNSTIEQIRQAQNDVNQEVLTNMYCSLTEFYEKIGLAQNTMSEEVGWNIDNMMDVKFSTVMSNDGRPCVSIDFNKTPVRDYYRVW